MRYSDPEVDRCCMEADQSIIEALQHLFFSFRQRLRIEDIQAAATVVSYAAEGVVHVLKLFPTPIKEDRLIHELADMICQYLFKDAD